MSIFYSHSTRNDESHKLYDKICEHLPGEIIDVDEQNHNNQLFEKISGHIDNSTLFICDITPDYIYNVDKQKLEYLLKDIPQINKLKTFINPNVMLELGYFLKNKKSNLILLCNKNLTKEISDLLPSMLRGMDICYYNPSNDDDKYYMTIVDNITEFKKNENDNETNKDWVTFEYNLSQKCIDIITGLMDIKLTSYFIRVNKKDKNGIIFFNNNYSNGTYRKLYINQKILKIKSKKEICLSYYPDIYSEIQHLELIINHQF